jgi:hypothetical protein
MEDYKVTAEYWEREANRLKSLLKKERQNRVNPHRRENPQRRKVSIIVDSNMLERLNEAADSEGKHLRDIIEAGMWAWLLRWEGEYTDGFV